MQLWTYQSLEAVGILEQSGRLHTPWSYYSSKDPFRLAYKWMAEQMRLKGVHIGEYAPIWAWHSCGTWEAPPTNDTASNLLSILQMEAGIKLLSLKCPDEVVVLSNYGPWNYIIDLFIDHRDQTTIDNKLQRQLFDIKTKLEDYESIQACLPHLRVEWVVDVKKLDASEIL